MAHRIRFSAVLIATSLAAGCAVPGPVSTVSPTRKPGVSPAATVKPVAAAPGLAAGKARLIPQVGTPRVLGGLATLISDNGGAIVSDHGGGLIGNNAAGIISNNSGGLIGNNAGGLIGNNAGSYRLAQDAKPQDAKPATYKLADADISVYDARGQVLTNEAGKPLTARTDAAGRYAFSGVLPAENLVLRIKLWNGGELSALLTQDAGAEVAIDTAATIGAAYVLSQYVKGDQATYDRLPDSEARRLSQALAAASVAQAPTYETAALVALAESIRREQPAVDKSLEDIKILLLGGLGDGLAATQVALSRPVSLAVAPDGTLDIGEYDFGRVRRVAPSGILTTYIDSSGGLMKGNTPGLTAVVRGPDGTLFIGSDARSTVYRAKVGDPEITPFVTGMKPGAVAFGGDGKLYVGVFGTPELWMVDPETGAKTAVTLPPELDVADGIRGVAVEADGTLHLLAYTAGSNTARLFQRKAGTWTLRVSDLETLRGSLTLGPDGLLYVLEDRARRLITIAPDGTRAVFLEGSSDASRVPYLLSPHAIALAADGTVYVADQDRNLVLAKSPAGVWRVAAGVASAVQSTDGSVTINAPTGVAFDAAGTMLIAEGAGHAIQRWDGQTLTRVAGSGKGNDGDGGPALNAHFDQPGSLAYRGDELLVLDSNNGAIRGIGTDGIVRHVLGGDSLSLNLPLRKGEVRPITAYSIKDGLGLGMSPDGRLYWSATGISQIARLRKDGGIELVAGSGLLDGDTGDGGDAADAKINTPMSFAFQPGTNGDSMVISDTGNTRLRRVTGLLSGTPRMEAFAGGQRADAIGKMLGLKLGFELAEEGILATEALFSVPTGLVYDAAGNLYVAEVGTRNVAELSRFSPGTIDSTGVTFSALPQLPPRIRKITPDGRVYTVAGPGGKLWADPEAADALGMPIALAIDPRGRLVIMDSRRNAIRIIPAGQY